MTGIIIEIDKDKIHVSFENDKKGLLKDKFSKLKSEQNTVRFAVKKDA